MLITLFQIMWHLTVLACILAGAAAYWLVRRRLIPWLRPERRWLRRAALAIWCAVLGVSLIGSAFSFIPAEETFTYTGGMPPVSDKFTEDFDTPFHYVYVQSGYLDHEGQRFYLNLFRFAFPRLKFEPQAGTVNIYRTAHEDLIVGRNSQMESYDNMVIAAYREAGHPLNYTTTYSVLTTYAMFPAAEPELKPGDVIVKYDGIPMNGRAGLDRYIRENKPASIRLEVERGGRSISVRVPLYDPFGYGGLHTLGFAIAEKKDYVLPESALPIPDKTKHSGSSAGLIMALQLYAHLAEPDLGRGFVIAGTGGITEDGKVAAIGALYHKTAAVGAKKADLFLVPKEQEQEALRYKEELGYDKLSIVGVSTLTEAIQAVRALNQ
jgi:PDZ domain-containing secreted protein